MTLEGKKIAFVVSAEGIEQAELTSPWQAVADAGGIPTLVSAEAGTVQAFQHLDPSETFPVDETLDEADPAEFEGVVLPGGVANGDQLRTQPAAVAFIASIAQAGKPIAVICHGGWVLIEAGVVTGRTLTSWPSLRTDYRNASATWIDQEVVVDEGPFTLVSSRKPDDLPAFDRELVKAFDR